MTLLEPGRIAHTGFGRARTATRARVGLVASLLILAGGGWVWTAREMRGMDGGPWTGLGGFGWFMSVWVVMMAAMMFPSVAPTVALYARLTRERSPVSPYAFAVGYLLTWAVAGLAAYVVGAAISGAFGDSLGWDHAGRPLAGATLLAAAGYELTPLKDVCLGKCRSPLGALLGSWRDGISGAVRMGTKNGGWCVGCCWALMVSLFALGVMSVTWMGLLAAVIAAEKLLPWRRTAVYGTAGLLGVLGLMTLLAPHSLPGFTIPRGGTGT